jgi:hypothetical protein
MPTGDLLLDMSQAMKEGVELSERQLQILVRVDQLAYVIYSLGFEAGRRAGWIATLEESIAVDDERLAFSKVDRPPTA